MAGVDLEECAWEWAQARRLFDDPVALELGLGALASGTCPLEIRLCLPGCWRLVRGEVGLEAFIDSLVEQARGVEKALLRVASAQLHPAALAQAEELEPRLLLLAASLGLGAQGRLEEACFGLSLCAVPQPRPGWFEFLIQAECAQASRLVVAQLPRSKVPDAPPAEISARVARKLEARAAQLGGCCPLEALGLLWLANSVLSLTLSDAARMRASAGEAAARVGLAGRAESWLEQARLPEATDAALRRVTLGLGKLRLEQDRPAEAEALFASLLEQLGPGSDLEQAAALAALGVAKAALGLWADSEPLLQQALAVFPRGSAEASACLRWLGLGRLARGAFAEAEGLLRSSLDDVAETVDRVGRAEGLLALGTALVNQGRRREAEARFQGACRLFLATLGAHSSRYLVAAGSLASLLLAQHRWREAEPLVRYLLARANEGAEGGSGPEAQRWQQALVQIAQQGVPSPPPRAPAPDVRAVLARFKRREVSPEEMLRSLMEHERWCVPRRLLPRGEVSPEVTAVGPEDRLPMGIFQVFTDLDAAERAARTGASPGPCVVGLSGVEVFRHADERYSGLQIDPHVPGAEEHGFERGAIAQLRRWAEIVLLERSLGSPSLEAPELLRGLASFPAYIVLWNRETHGLLTLVEHRGFSNAVVVFTAPDRAEAFASHVPAELQAMLAPLVMDGRTLFQALSKQGVDGIAFNGAGSGERVVAASLGEAALRAR